MFTKKLYLFIFLCFFSALLGFILSQLDFKGFFDGRHVTHLIHLIFIILFSYCISVIVFLLDFASRKNTLLGFGIAGLCFAIAFLVGSMDVLSTLVASIFFFLYIFYIYRDTLSRSKLYVKFTPRELLAPVVHNALLILLAILASVTFFQTQKLVENRSLVTPDVIRPFTKPLTFILNRELSSQLSTQLSGPLTQHLPQDAKERIIKDVLKETVKTMQDPKTKTVYGIPTSEIPTEKTIVNPDSSIDLTPVMEALLPAASLRINSLLANYSYVAPAIIAFAMFLILQPFTIPIHLIELGFSLVLFKILFSSGFIKIKKEMKEVEGVTLE